jgi:UDP-sulfoquinovose synthase
MKVVVFGGDGFCGWPTSLHLSAQGHEVVIVDNLVRRCADIELEVSSLTPIAAMSTRLQAWTEISGRTIRHLNFDVAQDYYRIAALLEDFRPDAVVHFAEQRAAPYSMKSERHKRYTVNNNVAASHNILCAIVESGQDIHVVHLGTMGVYGYGGGAAIPEGYLPIEIMSADGRRIPREILYPADPGSVYHMTKTLDQLLFYYYNKNDRVREAKGLVELGLKPTRLERGLLEEVVDVAKRYADRCDRQRIPCTSVWRRDAEVSPAAKRETAAVDGMAVHTR